MLANKILCAHPTRWPTAKPTTCATMTPMASNYTPNDDVAKLFARYKRHYEGERALKPEMIEMAKRELHAGASNSDLAKLTGLTDEFFRRIARAEGIQRKRPPTVGKEAEAAKKATED